MCLNKKLNKGRKPPPKLSTVNKKEAALTGLFLVGSVVKNKTTRGQQNGSAGKGICYQAWKPEFNPRPRTNSYKRNNNNLKNSG